MVEATTKGVLPAGDAMSSMNSSTRCYGPHRRSLPSFAISTDTKSIAKLSDG